ncbi:MAG: hypothetical protein F4158_01290 [Synechococcus sp. SB0675_bin_7]|nr:hypothetical protein [Synechococcus sp. SB0675_bin_7]
MVAGGRNRQGRVYLGGLHKRGLVLAPPNSGRQHRRAGWHLYDADRVGGRPHHEQRHGFHPRQRSDGGESRPGGIGGGERGRSVYVQDDAGPGAGEGRDHRRAAGDIRRGGERRRLHAVCEERHGRGTLRDQYPHAELALLGRGRTDGDAGVDPQHHGDMQDCARSGRHRGEQLRPGQPGHQCANVGGGADPSETNNGFSVNVVPPSKATGLSAVAGNGEVSLSWSDPGNSDISGWQVQQKEGTGSYGSWTAISGSGASTTSHTVTGLSNGTAYTFRIRAVAGTVNGAASAEVTATPLAPVVEFSAASYDGSEAAGSGTVTVGLSATPAFSTSTTVSYSVRGTASSGTDFTALAGAVSMTGGGGSLAVSILDDRVDEEAETMVLHLEAGSGYNGSHGVQPQEGGAEL